LKNPKQQQQQISTKSEQKAGKKKIFREEPKEADLTLNPCEEEDETEKTQKNS
jgi:hypothetical protein